MWLRDIIPGIIADALGGCAARGLEDFIDVPLNCGGNGFLDRGRTSLTVHDLIDVARREPERASDATDRLAASNEFGLPIGWPHGHCLCTVHIVPLTLIALSDFRKGRSAKREKVYIWRGLSMAEDARDAEQRRRRAEGDRVRAIRELLGINQPQFAAQLTAEAKTLGLAWLRYDNTIVSKLEIGTRDLSIDDTVVIAAVDPLQRGQIWLMTGDERHVITESSTITRPLGQRLLVERTEDAINKRTGKAGKGRGRRDGTKG